VRLSLVLGAITALAIGVVLPAAVVTEQSTGMSNKLIARALSIREGAVKVHVKHRLRKLEFRSRAEAAVWATELGLRQQ